MAKYIKPTLQTKYHIDFAWWQKAAQKLRSHLRGHVCEECQALLDTEPELFDWVHPETAEVFQIDKLWHCLYTKCAQDPDFIDHRTPLMTAIFRVFIAGNNTPLTPVELYSKLQRKSPELIMKTIGGRKVYQGIRPMGTTR